MTNLTPRSLIHADALRTPWHVCRCVEPDGAILTACGQRLLAPNPDTPPAPTWGLCPRCAEAIGQPCCPQHHTKENAHD